MKQNDAENTEERPQTQAEEEQRGRVLKVRATHVGTTLQCHPDWAGGMAGGWGTGGGGAGRLCSTGVTQRCWGCKVQKIGGLTCARGLVMGWSGAQGWRGRGLHVGSRGLGA